VVWGSFQFGDQHIYLGLELENHVLHYYVGACDLAARQRGLRGPGDVDRSLLPRQ